MLIPRVASYGYVLDYVIIMIYGIVYALIVYVNIMNYMQIRGQDISWQHLTRLYERHCTVKHSSPGLTILLKY